MKKPVRYVRPLHWQCDCCPASATQSILNEAFQVVAQTCPDCLEKVVRWYRLNGFAVRNAPTGKEPAWNITSAE